jgi:hypothetical protein
MKFSKPGCFWCCIGVWPVVVSRTGWPISRCRIAVVHFGSPTPMLMKVPCHRRLAQPWAGAFLAFWAYGLATPTVVQATCGSHVTPRTTPLEVGIESELLGLLEGSARAPAAPAPRPTPCVGLMCSARPLIPMAPAPPSLQRSPQWGCLMAPPPWAAPKPVSNATVEAHKHPIHRRGPIERPPRLLSCSLPSLSG